MTIGEKIKKLRLAAEMSQEQLASRLYVSRQCVSKWERDAAAPCVYSVVRISEIFGVTTDFLLKNPPQIGNFGENGVVLGFGGGFGGVKSRRVYTMTERVAKKAERAKRRKKAERFVQVRLRSG
ncbi:MAG: helix-turn-helix domain-containing protein [Defluviitaleaceae bacterium]|nr:helix-turn-helix domain-containing protein [Defluviitaleaceae bacterium]